MSVWTDPPLGCDDDPCQGACSPRVHGGEVILYLTAPYR
jgi:hypothetical protein